MERAELEALVRATGVAEAFGGSVFLPDPHWSSAQRQAFAALVQSEARKPKSEISQGWLCIPTGGSSGATSAHNSSETIHGGCSPLLTFRRNDPHVQSVTPNII